MGAYEKKLEKKCMRKRELRVQKCNCKSFSGFSNISSVSNINPFTSWGDDT